MVTGAANLMRQPAHAALVSFQLSLDEVSDMDADVVFHGSYSVRASALILGKKKRETIIASCP